jgi:hypothetical protein
MSDNRQAVHYERDLENKREKIHEHYSDFTVWLVNLHYGMTGNAGIWKSTEVK